MTAQVGLLLRGACIAGRTSCFLGRARDRRRGPFSLLFVVDDFGLSKAVKMRERAATALSSDLTSGAEAAHSSWPK
jgi:hypothetical protein